MLECRRWASTSSESVPAHPWPRPSAFRVPPVSFDVVLLLVLLEAILGHEFLLLEGSADRRFQVLDGPATENLPCSPSNTQAGMRFCRGAATSGPVGGIGPGFSGCLPQPGVAPDRACLGGVDPRDVGVRDRRRRLRLRAGRRHGRRRGRPGPLARRRFASPFAALLGDRYDRRWVMVASDLARAALIAGAALAVFLDAPPIVIYVIAGLVGVAATAFRPAEAALVPTLARTPEELTAANVAASTIESVGIFGGPAIGGLLLAVSGPGVVFLVTACALLWSAFLVAGVHPLERRRRRSSRSRSPWSTSCSRASGRLPASVACVFSSGCSPPRRSLTGCSTCSSSSSRSSCSTPGQAGVGFLNSAVGIGGLLGARRPRPRSSHESARPPTSASGSSSGAFRSPSSRSGRIRSLCSSCSRSSASATRSSTSRG